MCHLTKKGRQHAVDHNVWRAGIPGSHQKEEKKIETTASPNYMLHHFTPPDLTLTLRKPYGNPTLHTTTDLQIQKRRFHWSALLKRTCSRVNNGYDSSDGSAGSTKQKALPSPGLLSTHTRPLCFSMAVLTIASPNPVPKMPAVFSDSTR